MAKAAPFHLPQAWFNAFATHEWINQDLLENIPVAAWDVEPPESKGRTVAAIFAPMHNAVSYTHLRSPRDGLLSRMPSSA